MQFRFLNDVENWTGAQLALAYVLHNPEVSCAVMGTTRLQHLRDNIEASGRIIPDHILQQIRQEHGAMAAA